METLTKGTSVAFRDGLGNQYQGEVFKDTTPENNMVAVQSENDTIVHVLRKNLVVADEPPIGAKLEVVCLIDPATWAQAKAHGVSEVDLQKAIEAQVTLITDKGLRLLWEIDSVKLVKYY